MEKLQVALEFHEYVQFSRPVSCVEGEKEFHPSV